MIYEDIEEIIKHQYFGQTEDDYDDEEDYYDD